MTRTNPASPINGNGASNAPQVAAAIAGTGISAVVTTRDRAVGSVTAVEAIIAMTTPNRPEVAGCPTDDANPANTASDNPTATSVETARRNRVKPGSDTTSQSRTRPFHTLPSSPTPQQRSHRDARRRSQLGISAGSDP